MSRSTWPRLWLAVLVPFAAGCVPLWVGFYHAKGNAQSPSDSAADDLSKVAFVVDNGVIGGGPNSGCAAVSIIDVDARAVIHRGTTVSTVRQIDVGADGDEIVASPGRGNSSHAVRWLRAGDDWNAWSGQGLLAPTNATARLLTLAGIALLPRQGTLLMGLSGPGMNIGAFRVADIDRTMPETNLPAALRYGFTSSGGSSVILVTRDESVAHIVGQYGRVNSVETSTLRPVAPSIVHAPFVPDPLLEGGLAQLGFTSTAQIVFADLSVDERYLVTNRWAVPEISVLDLQERRSWTLPVGDGITMTGGVAFNHGWENPGLLAINALHSVVVYRFTPDGPLEELSRHPIPARGHFGAFEWRDVPIPGNVAWSARGDHLIVPIDHGDNDFAILDVTACGAAMRLVAELAVCAGDVNSGHAIWTANKRLTPPPDTVQGCPMSQRQATATPPVPPAATATPIATAVWPDYSEARIEDKVTVFEGSAEGSAAGCGGLTYFQIGQGEPLFQTSNLAGAGRLASTDYAGTFIVGPSDAAQRSYRVAEENRHGFDSAQVRERLWDLATVSPTVGIPLPYGAMSVVWAQTQVLLTYQDPATGRAALGLFDRFEAQGPPPGSPLAEVTFERGVPAEVVLADYTREEALQRYGGMAWVVTDLGEVWRVTIRDMVEMTIEGPVANLGAPAALPGDDGPAARRVHAALSAGERYLLVSGWGEGVLNIVDLTNGRVRRVSAGAGLTMTGQIAVNGGWENEGLVAVHAGDHIVVYALDEADGTLVELHRQAIAPPRDESGRPEPGFVAWGTNGLTIIATIDEGDDEFVAYWVRGCGRSLQLMYRVSGCAQPGVKNRGRHIVTNNRFLGPPEGYVAACPAGVIPPVPTPSPWVPTSTIHLPFAGRPPS